MAGDLGVRERLVILPEGGAGVRAAFAPEARLSANGGRIMHVYGDRVLIAEMPPGAEQPLAAAMGRSAVIEEDVKAAAKAATGSLSEVEEMGVEAFALRQSAKYKQAKANRPRAGEEWDSGKGGEPLRCADMQAEQEAAGLAPDAQAGETPATTALSSNGRNGRTRGFGCTISRSCRSATNAVTTACALPEVRSVTSGAPDADTLDTLDAGDRLFAEAWGLQADMADKQRPGEGLDWNAEGFDPPG